VVHLDETTAHAHCDIVPVNEQGRISYKDVFHGHTKSEYKQFILQLHNELAEVNRKWGLARGTIKVLTGTKGRTTESYRRWLNQECDSLEERRNNLKKAIDELNRELATATTKHKSFTTMIANLTAQKEELERELESLHELQKKDDAISQEIARKIQDLENRKAYVEEKLAEKEAKLSSTSQEIESLRQDKEALEQEASELAAKATESELDWAHNKGAVMNELLAGMMMHEFTSRYQRLPDEAKEVFSDTLLEQLATEGNHVATVALALMCEYVEQATSIAQTHGGGGSGPGGGWRKKEDEDERMFARRSLTIARRMCRSSGRRKKL
jgi:chromosome segregation ATPase